jgi:hypothetical protein
MREWLEHIVAGVLFWCLMVLLYVMAVLATNGDPKYW